MVGKKKIGILSLQGCVLEHKKHIEDAGADFLELKSKSDFYQCNGIILPGGESTTMLNLINKFEMWDFLKKEFLEKPVWGICAGSILLASKIQNSAQKSFAIMDMEIERNAYGSQNESFSTCVNDYNVFFIRAPQIAKVNKNIEVIHSYKDKATWVMSGKNMATTFHPELNELSPSPMHTKFIELVNEFQ